MADTISLQDLAKEYGVGAKAPAPAVAKGLPEAWDLDSEVKSAADKAGIPYPLFRGLVKQESSDKHDVVSPAGAIGYAQLMPDTAKRLGVDPHDPRQNLAGGATNLKQLLDQFGGDVPKALAGYNAGPQAVIDHGGIPPYPETQKYVPKVMGYAKDFEEKAATANPDGTLEDMMKRYGVSAQPAAPQAPASGGAPKMVAPDVDPFAGKPKGDTSWTSKINAAGVGLIKGINPFYGMGGRPTSLYPGAKGSDLPPYGFYPGPGDPLGDPAFRQKSLENIQHQWDVEHAATEANPWTAGVTEGVTSVLSPTNPISKIDEIGKMLKLSLIPRALIGGGAAGGLHRAVNDPNATLGDIGTSAGIGAIAGVPIALGGQALSSLGTRALDRIGGSSGAGKFIAEKLGLTKSLESLENKNQNLLTENNSKLNQALATNPHEMVPLPGVEDGANPLIPKDLEDLAGKYAAGKDLNTAKRIQEIMKSAQKNEGYINKADATDLKRLFAENSRTASGQVAHGIAPKVLEEWRNHLQLGIENAEKSTVGPGIGKINADLGKGIGIKDQIANTLASPPKEIPYYRPGKALLQTVPGATAAAAAGNKLTVPMARILGTFLPSLFNGNAPQKK